LKTKLLLKDIVVVLIFLLIGCKDKEEPLPTHGYLNVTVKSLSDNKPVGKSYIFLNDSLYGKTNESGVYLNDSVKPGNYTLTCSAINLRDTSLTITINVGVKTRLSFLLTVDSTLGMVLGEFQDLTVFRQKAITKPQIIKWDEKQVHDGVTGATIYKITYPDPIPPRTVSLDDSTLAVSDGFGQYWFKIQSGTYLIKGACNGYSDASRLIKVLPGSKNYFNFYLEKK
jgi:hypothetical protein